MAIMRFAGSRVNKADGTTWSVMGPGSVGDTLCGAIGGAGGLVARRVGSVRGVVLAAVTTPVGVSGAVLLLPFQLSVLGVPNPRVTPTNLLYNVISGPGGLARYRTHGQFDRTLTRQILAGAVPGVVLGAVIRVFVAPDPDVFRLLAAVVLAPVGLFILRKPSPGSIDRLLTPTGIRVLAFVFGTVGGSTASGAGPSWVTCRSGRAWL